MMNIVETKGRGATMLKKRPMKLSMKITMKAKLWISYMAIVFLLLVISGIAIFSLEKLTVSVDELTSEEIIKVNGAGNLTENMSRLRLFVSKHATEITPVRKNFAEQSINESVKQVQEDVEVLRPLLKTVETKNNLDLFEKEFAAYVELIPQALDRSNDNDMEGFATVFQKMDIIGERSVYQLEPLQAGILEYAEKVGSDTSALTIGSKVIIQIIALISVLISIVVVYFITRTIGRSVTSVVDNVEVTTDSAAEIKRSIDQTASSAKVLDASMNKANDSVSELVTSIQQVAGNTNVTASGVDDISAAVEEMSASINLVAASADQLAVSAEETSSAIQEMMASIEQVAGNTSNAGVSVEQISAAIEEMSQSIKGVNNHAVELTSSTQQTAHTIDEMLASIKQVAASANTVNHLSHTVKDDAMKGTDSVGETLNGMKEISKVIKDASVVMENLGESSKEIGSIIEVIDDIAEQTNLLALNAAIEAARAGEHGKGFAVVADEVRKLAERSAKATKEIANLINSIQAETAVAVTSIKAGEEKVEVGNQLAEITHDAIMKITQGIAQVTAEMTQIAHATEEQKKNSEFIVAAVENTLNKATEMNNSTKEQTFTAEEIVRGITDTKEQVHQISIAIAEQTKGSQAIVEAIENVTNQSSSVTNATKEQALTSDEIVQNINGIKEMIQQMTIATTDQAKYGQDIAQEIEKVRKQTEELTTGIEIQTKEVAEVVQSVKKVNDVVGKLK